MVIKRQDMWVWTLVWGAIAAVLIGVGVYETAPPPVIPISIWTPPIIVAIWWRRDPGLKAWARAVDIRWLALIHLTRVGFGGGFLWLLSKGELPWEFALHGGIGDILAGLGALSLLALFPKPDVRGERIWRYWNYFALADILLVFASANYLLFTGRFEELSPLRQLPYSTIPCFVVPMILVTHGLMIWGRLDPKRAS